jgi:hypothetical protein
MYREIYNKPVEVTPDKTAGEVKIKAVKKKKVKKGDK